MRRTFFPWFVLAGTSCLFAQDAPPTPEALAAGKQRLAAALQKTAVMNDVAFAATWGPDRKDKKKDDEPVLAMFGAQSGGMHGSWHRDLQHVAIDGDTGDELLFSGPRMVARDKDREWRLRSGRYADGNNLVFATAPALLLQQLASMDLAVVHRSPGAIDDRPVEIVTVTLNADQVADLAWSGAMPDALFVNGVPFGFAAMAMRGAARPAAARPAATLDVAFAIDPGTSLVHEVRCRSWTKNDGNGQGVVFRAGGGGVVRIATNNGGTNDDDEDADADAKKKAEPAGPMQFENGLPVRPRKKTTVMDFTVRLTEHGAAKAPELGDDVKKLLGR